MLKRRQKNNTLLNFQRGNFLYSSRDYILVPPDAGEKLKKKLLADSRNGCRLQSDTLRSCKVAKPTRLDLYILISFEKAWEFYGLLFSFSFLFLNRVYN